MCSEHALTENTHIYILITIWLTFTKLEINSDSMMLKKAWKAGSCLRLNCTRIVTTGCNWNIQYQSFSVGDYEGLVVV